MQLLLVYVFPTYSKFATFFKYLGTLLTRLEEIQQHLDYRPSKNLSPFWQPQSRLISRKKKKKGAKRRPFEPVLKSGRLDVLILTLMDGVL